MVDGVDLNADAELKGAGLGGLAHACQVWIPAYGSQAGTYKNGDGQAASGKSLRVDQRTKDVERRGVQVPVISGICSRFENVICAYFARFGYR